MTEKVMVANSARQSTLGFYHCASPSVCRAVSSLHGETASTSDGLTMNARNSRLVTMAANIRDALHILADQLPEGATWRDVAYEAYVRQEVEAGLEEARRGDFASDDEVRSAFAKWGVQLETEVDTPRT